MTMRRLVMVGLLAGLVLVPAADAVAQRGSMRGRVTREQLEERLRVRLATLLKTQLELTDEQMRQLSEVNQRFDARRRNLVRREMENRRLLRQEILRKAEADQGKVDQYLAEQLRVERERIDLTEAEQRELGRFLTAVQRARYLGVQEQIRREMEQLRGRGMPPIGLEPPDSAAGRGPRRPPPA
jgi:aromatic ring-cleaving dioxygenase